ncbi:lactate utilization protein B [Bacteroidia bacterium]|nr:lactate utilization protein B [Bacteroidia bacterium]
MATNDTVRNYLAEAKKNLKNQPLRSYREGLYEHYRTVNNTLDTFFAQHKLLKDRVVFSKYNAIEKLEYYIRQFEFIFMRRGGKVLWANDVQEAQSQIVNILKSKGINRIATANSKTLDELQITRILPQNDISCLSTECNAFYQQQTKTPTHSAHYPILSTDFKAVATAVQKSMDLQDKDIAETIDGIKRYLLDQMNTIKASIVGANFLISDIGGIILCENQGNITMNIAFSDVLFVVCGIDKIVPKIDDLERYLTLLSAHTSGTMLPWQTHILTSPSREEKSDIPREIYVILLDNKRSEVMKHVKQRQILRCIRCGACAAVCPVYRHVGDEPYRSVYAGPIGAVVNPFMQNFENTVHQAYACTLCKQCTEVCPMNIPIHELILQNRQEAVKRECYVTFDRTQIRRLRKMMLARTAMDSTFNNFILRNNFKHLVGDQRVFPNIGQPSFSERYIEKYRLKSE